LSWISIFFFFFNICALLKISKLFLNLWSNLHIYEVFIFHYSEHSLKIPHAHKNWIFEVIEKVEGNSLLKYLFTEKKSSNMKEKILVDTRKYK